MSLSPACYPGPPEIYLDPHNRSLASLVVTPPLHGNQSMCYGNPFAPYGGAKEWNNNELLLKDDCMRRLAYVAPLDCDITALYYVNPIPKI